MVAAEAWRFGRCYAGSGPAFSMLMMKCISISSETWRVDKSVSSDGSSKARGHNVRGQWRLVYKLNTKCTRILPQGEEVEYRVEGLVL